VELRPDESPWELVARGEAVLVRPSLGDGPRTTWRAPLGPTSVLSRHLQAAASMLGTGNRVAPRFHVEFPAGSGPADLVSAIGGGFRGTVRTAGSGGLISGQVRLVPVPRQIRAAALGPMLGLMAFTMVTEMAAAAEQDRKLTAILATVERIDARLRMESDARLRTAEQTIRQAHAALLDRAAIPESVGLGAAMSHVQDIRNVSATLLDGWERVADKHGGSPMPGSVVRKELGQVGNLGWEGFADAVRTAHLAHVLDSRRLVLVAAEAQTHNPESPLRHLRHALADDLAERTRDLNRLHGVLTRLAGTPLTISAWEAGVLPHLITEKAVDNAEPRRCSPDSPRPLPARRTRHRSPAGSTPSSARQARCASWPQSPEALQDQWLMHHPRIIPAPTSRRVPVPPFDARRHGSPGASWLRRWFTAAAGSSSVRIPTTRTVANRPNAPDTCIRRAPFSPVVGWTSSAAGWCPGGE
jgi:hypothetical protein